MKALQVPTPNLTGNSMKGIRNITIGCGLLVVLALSSCANTTKTSEFAPEKEMDTIPPVTQDIPGTKTDTLNNPDAEPVQQP
jgi:hypothetical protein